MIRRILGDLQKNIKPIILIVGLWGITTLLFHNFCPVVLLCGFPCPGCGLTRAIFSMLTFHPLEALRYNPSYPLWVIMLVLFFVLRYALGKSTKQLIYPMFIVLIFTVAVFIWRINNSFPSHEPMVYESRNLFGMLNPNYNILMNKMFN